MSSLYKALNEDDVMSARFNYLNDGEYDAMIKFATRSISKIGNVMGDLSVSVFDKEGNTHDLRDFLVFTPKMLWKVKHFCDSSGLEKEYIEERFTPEMAQGKFVRVRVARQFGNEIPEDKLNGKAPGARYPDKNVIEDYIPGATRVNGKPSDECFINDEIPF